MIINPLLLDASQMLGNKKFMTGDTLTDEDINIYNQIVPLKQELFIYQN